MYIFFGTPGVTYSKVLEHNHSKIVQMLLTWVFYSSFLQQEMSTSSTGKSLALGKSQFPPTLGWSPVSWCLDTCLHIKSRGYHLSSENYIISVTCSVSPQKDSSNFTYLQRLTAFPFWSFTSCCHSLLICCIS